MPVPNLCCCVLVVHNAPPYSRPLCKANKEDWIVPPPPPPAFFYPLIYEAKEKPAVVE